ncbi:MAG: FAD binding domain-containing protein [Pseudomonadota bacterium]
MRQRTATGDFPIDSDADQNSATSASVTDDHERGLWINADWVALDDAPPDVSLLQHLREQERLTGTKEGCASGDCGACSVLVHAADGGVHAVNACITPLGAVLGAQVVTVEGIGTPEAMHPVQRAMVELHGSQCGFCTPGFVAALAAHTINGTAEGIADGIAGNLCRCTGYGPILAAGRIAFDVIAREHAAVARDALPVLGAAAPTHLAAPRYRRPRDRAELHAAMRDGWPLIAGGTDRWLGVSQQFERPPGWVDVSVVRELMRLEYERDELIIGSAVTVATLEAFARERSSLLTEMLRRYGSPQIRGRATIGGNVGNASPIADWPPVLLALGADIVLSDARGSERRLPLAEYWRGYRETVRAADEYIVEFRVSGPIDWAALKVFKVSKREDDDISTVLGAFYLQRDGAIVNKARVAFGGVAATPVRLPAVEAALVGRAADDAGDALVALDTALAPITDVRASADYRRAMAAALLLRALDDAPEPQTLQELLD